MCGLAGFLDLRQRRGPEALETLARRMVGTVRHRGPDSAGAWVDAAAGVAFGHQRLAIIDLSKEGHQPMVSASGRFVIAYNGEVYNFPELRGELEALGHCFRGHSDTEVVLAAIEQWGLQAALGRCIGMFAFALWDSAERRLHLARDRFGIKPLYYAHTGACFLFGSELRALEAHPEFSGEIDRDVLTLYLRRNCVPSPYSIFTGVRKLPPGTVLSFAAGDSEPRLEPYWRLRQVAEDGQGALFQGTEDDAVDELERLLGDAVRRRLVADVPLGVFLSGGIDSSTVTALMMRAASTRVKSFSIGFSNAGYDEARDAAAVARHLETDHHEYYVSDGDAQSVVPRLAAMYDEPFSDSSQLPTYLVSRLAREHVTVALSGDGGDELFGGYNRHLWCDLVARRTGWLPAPLRRAAAIALTALPPHRWDQIGGFLGQRNPGDKLHKLAGVIDAGSAQEMYEGLVSNWRTPEDIVLGGREAGSLVRCHEGWARLPDFTSQMMYLDAMTYLPDDVLTKVDRASMAVSLEARVPMLDHRVAAFAWSLPKEMKVRGRVGKVLLRRLLSRHVPPALFERPKMGFAVPIHDWLRGPLRDWAEALLDETRLKRDGFFAPEPIRRRWQEHLSGTRNWQHQIWDILMFQGWLDAKRM